MKRPQSRRCVRVRQGVSLLEMLILLALMAGVAEIAQSILFSVFRVNGQNAQMQDTLSRGDDLLRQLKVDLWEARQVRVADAHHLILEMDEEQSLTWQIDPAGNVNRLVDPLASPTTKPAEPMPGGDRSRQWPDVGASWAFASDPCGIHLIDTRNDPPRGRVMLLNRQLWSHAIEEGGPR